MAKSLFSDDPQTVELLRSMRVLMRWLSSVSPEMRQRLLVALMERSDEIQRALLPIVAIIENPHATTAERRSALATIANVLFLNLDDKDQFCGDPMESVDNSALESGSSGREVQKNDCQESDFADRLRELMALKCVTQQELSGRVGSSQPAISQILNRKCRPQKRTIVKLAEALQVQPRELWPDLDVADMLDAVADFLQDDYAMTEAEANALRDTTKTNGPNIPVRQLPAR